ncbi:unnamed protein product [Merluccius merluccius]
MIPRYQMGRNASSSKSYIPPPHFGLGVGSRVKASFVKSRSEAFDSLVGSCGDLLVLGPLSLLSFPDRLYLLAAMASGREPL